MKMQEMWQINGDDPVRGAKQQEKGDYKKIREQGLAHSLKWVRSNMNLNLIQRYTYIHTEHNTAINISGSLRKREREAVAEMECRWAQIKTLTEKGEKLKRISCLCR